MRFSIATAFLSCTLPAASLLERKKQRGRRALQNLDTVARPVRPEERLAFQRRSQSDSFFAQYENSNPELTNEASSAECDPNSADVDVGILSCGDGRYCIESGDSTLGGVCVNESVERDLQLDPPNYLCNKTHPMHGLYYDCNCKEFDEMSNYGYIDCYGTYLYCESDDNTTCAFFTYSILAYGAYNYTSIYCTNFVSPYFQQACYLYASDGGCALAINGDFCDACYPNTYPIPDSTYYGYCLDFKCMNTCANRDGSTCVGDPFIPITDDSRTEALCYDTESPTGSPSDSPSLMPTASPSSKPTGAPVEAAQVAGPPTPAPANADTPTDTPMQDIDPNSAVAGVESAGDALFTTKTAASLLGLSMSLAIYFTA